MKKKDLFICFDCLCAFVRIAGFLYIILTFFFASSFDVVNLYLLLELSRSNHDESRSKLRVSNSSSIVNTLSFPPLLNSCLAVASKPKVHLKVVTFDIYKINLPLLRFLKHIFLFSFLSKYQNHESCHTKSYQSKCYRLVNREIKHKLYPDHINQYLFLVDNKVVGSIGKGICVLLGIGTDDTDKDVDYMVNKILNVRVFDEDGVMWKKGVQASGLELLCGKRERKKRDYI